MDNPSPMPTGPPPLMDLAMIRLKVRRATPLEEVLQMIDNVREAVIHNYKAAVDALPPEGGFISWRNILAQSSLDLIPELEKLLEGDDISDLLEKIKLMEEATKGESVPQPPSREAHVTPAPDSSAPVSSSAAEPALGEGRHSRNRDGHGRSK